jgi:hypothetical protein
MKKFKDIIKRNPEPARGKLGINPMDPWSAKYGIAEDDMSEDLRKWFNQNWVRMDTKGNIKGDCARKPGEGKPKCLPQAKAQALGKEGRAKAARRKRREDPDPDRRGKPINVRTEEKEMNEDETNEACWTGYTAKGMKKKGNRMVPNCVPEEVEQIEEKNVPTSPEKWARAKAAAKSKFAVYPSAYANGWASKKYKAMGGGWKSVSENHVAIAMGNMMDDEGSMVLNQLEQLERACGMIRSHIGKDYEKQLPAWVQSKITLATDYIDTVGNYLISKNEKMTEEMVNEISKDKVERYISKVGDDQEKKHGFQRNMYSKLEPKRQRGVNRALDRLAVKEEHKVGDSVTVNSKFFGKKKGIVKKVDNQSVHVQRDGNKFSEKYPHDAVVKESAGITKTKETSFHKKLDTLVHKTFGKRKDELKMKEEVEQIDELNYDTVKSLYQKRRADFQGAQVGKKKKGKDVSAKNVSTSISRMMGYKPTQNQPQKEEVEQIDELNYDTVNSYDSKRKANPSSKKSPEVVTKNRTSSINRFMGKIRTQSSPMQGVKRELTPQQKTLQKDYHDSQRRGMSTEEVVNELSNELLGSYKKKAGEQASAADKAGDFKKGNKRFSGIVKATKKQFANDVKEETLDELNKDTLKSYLNKSTEIRKDSKSELKDIEKRPEIYKDNTDRAQQNLATKANKLKTTINKRTTGLNRAFNKLHGVAEAVDKKQMSKSARMIKALYKHHNVKEDMMDWEKGDKSTQSYGKKPNFKMTDKNADTSDTKFDARAVMKGGTTLTGQPRDMVEIDPSMKQRPGGQSTFTKDNMKKAPNN